MPILPIGPLSPPLPRAALRALLGPSTDPTAALDGLASDLSGWAWPDEDERGVAVAVSEPAAGLTRWLHDLPEGDVVLPAWGPAWLGAAVRAAGRRPLFADLSEESFLMGAEQVREALDQSDRSAAAVVASAPFGAPPDLNALAALCAERGLALIEDVTRALGARFAGQPMGTFGSCGLFSLGLLPAAGAVRGGLLLTRERDRAARLPRPTPQTAPGQTLRLLLASTLTDPTLFGVLNPAMARFGDHGRWLPRLLGHPARRLGHAGPAVTDMGYTPGSETAALAPASALAALRYVFTRLDRTSQMRSNHGRAIAAGLAHAGEAEPPAPVRFADPAFSSLPLRVDDDIVDQVRHELESRGLAPVAPPGTLLSAQDGSAQDRVARELHRELIFLPLHPHYRKPQIHFICESVRQSINAAIDQ